MSAPARVLTVRYVVVVTIAMVVGAGIFKSPALVAEYAGSEQMVYLLWLAGGVISLVGALCYAELASAFPHPGGDYHFLERAFGSGFAFLFAWSRLAVINTGSVALLAFVTGDYLNRVVDLGDHGPALYAFASVICLTGLKLLPLGGRADTGLVLVLIMGLLMLGTAGAFLAVQGIAPADPSLPGSPGLAGAGYGLIFVLLAFGGWTESATLSAEVRDGQRGMMQALVISILIITGLYLLTTWAMLQGLGLGGLARSSAPAADLMARAFGEEAGAFLALAVAAAAITSVNATIIAGARTVYAAAARFRALAPLARWNERTASPRNAILAQGGISLLLTGVAAVFDGFQTLVDYTAPVYWLFLIASGLALLKLRRTAGSVSRPFKVPAYPMLPLAFILCSGVMLVSALFYVGPGTVISLLVLLSGLVVRHLVVRLAR